MYWVDVSLAQKIGLKFYQSQAEGSQPTQPNPNPIHRRGRPVVPEQTSRSSAQEIDARFSLDCENTNLFVERLEKDKDPDKDVDADRDRTGRPVVGVHFLSPFGRQCSVHAWCLQFGCTQLSGTVLLCDSETLDRVFRHAQCLCNRVDQNAQQQSVTSKTSENNPCVNTNVKFFSFVWSFCGSCENHASA